MRQSLHSGRRRLIGLLATGALVTGAFAASPVQAAPSVGNTKADNAAAGKARNDNRRSPLAVKKDALRQKALEKRLKGDPKAQGKVAKLGKGQYVQLEREGTDRIFAVIVEFGDKQYPNALFQGPPPDGSTTDVTGPLHNQIPAPDRSVDNSTLWQKDYNQAHYDDMYFNRMAKYYETQSSGRYSVDGDVTEWVKVPFNEALYGRNYCGDIVCPTSKALVRDALAMWVDGQLKSGKSLKSVQDYLKTFDIQDRYDVDGDGEFAEPDGVIDHFQIVHAGGDEAAGDPNQGTDAIWSHRWQSNLQLGGPLGVGVDVGSNGGLVSSSEVPNNPTGMWVYDYTVQPENGGLGVFAHEFGHDLDLPDLYDTSGNTGGAENNTAFWTLMSSGANIGDGGRDGIGDNPTDLGAYELFQLGWLQPQGKQGPFYDVATAGKRSSHTLGSNAPATKQAQALFTVLPDTTKTFSVGAPFQGAWQFYSTLGDDLETTMTKTGVSGTALSAKVNYAMETEFDYAYVEVSSNGGTSWTPIKTSRSDAAGHTGHDPDGNNPTGLGITGTTNGAWVDVTATLPAGTNAIRFRYDTDPAVTGNGIRIDQVTLDGTVIGTAESADEGWTFDGFVRAQQTYTTPAQYFNAYIAENRQYDGYDASLRTAYNFGFVNTRPDWVEDYPYQNGLLINYWNSAYDDNNVGDHPGKGLVLPVDAHPEFSHWPDATLMRNRILSYDSTFGLEATDAITLHNNGVAGSIASKPAQPVFDDTRTWWVNADQHGATGSHPGRYQPGWYGVDVPKTGTTIRVVGTSKQGNSLNVLVAPK